MCGIAGFHVPEGARLGPWLADALEAARHRGPDGDGWWVPGMPAARRLTDLRIEPEQRVTTALGFVRLKILDLSPTGDQPMLDADRSALVFNGEIYNYVELRERLRGLGHASRSTGDTETIIHGWRQWGFEALEALDGMWALALWDRERDGMLLARDRFGEKPLFWTRYGGGVAFASEVKQLAHVPGVTLRLDPDRAAAHLATGRPYIGSSSWFEGIHQLEPGGWLWIDRHGLRTGRSYDLRASVRAVPPSRTPEAWGERFGAALTDSVRLRLRSDVPVGTSLSAGVDSSAIMAEATALGHQGYHSFTLGAEDPALDERGQAASFAREMGSVWHGVTATAGGFASAWDRLTWHQEAPVAGTTLFGQWTVMEAARASGVIVMLDGQGADEILGGYHKFFAAHVLRTVRERPWAAPLEAARFLRHVGGPGAIRRDGVRYLGRGGSGPGVASILTRPIPAARTPSLRAEPRRMRLADIETWSLPNLLSYADRNAMAHGVETRLPFLAPSVVELALAMPHDVLVRDGWTKWPLRRSLAIRGGAEPAWRRGKRWFGVPQAAWLRGPLRGHVTAFAERPHAAWESFADPAGATRIAKRWPDHAGDPAWDDALFTMVALDRFLHRFFPV